MFNGHVFFKVKSKFKIGVDPEFRFDFLRKLGKIIINPFNLYNKYFLKTSDEFFKEDARIVFNGKQIDIALVDGMHEYHFALRDVENILQYLDSDGIIIMHDCNPKSEEASITFNQWKERGMSGTWNGDLWKTIVHLRTYRKDINVFVLDCDHGLGIVSKRKPENTLELPVGDVDNLTYQQFNANRSKWLNLKNADYIFSYLKQERLIDEDVSGNIQIPK